MALVPATMRPGFIVRRKAMRRGVLGPSTLWKVVAIVVFGRNTIKKIFGKQPDVLGRRTITAGHVITVAASKPLTRKQRKQQGITLESLRTAAAADLEAVQETS